MKKSLIILCAAASLGGLHAQDTRTISDGLQTGTSAGSDPLMLRGSAASTNLFRNRQSVLHGTNSIGTALAFTNEQLNSTASLTNGVILTDPAGAQSTVGGFPASTFPGGSTNLNGTLLVPPGNSTINPLNTSLTMPGTTVSPLNTGDPINNGSIGNPVNNTGTIGNPGLVNPALNANQGTATGIGSGASGSQGSAPVGTGASGSGTVSPTPGAAAPFNGNPVGNSFNGNNANPANGANPFNSSTANPAAPIGNAQPARMLPPPTSPAVGGGAVPAAAAGPHK